MARAWSLSLILALLGVLLAACGASSAGTAYTAPPSAPSPAAPPSPTAPPSSTATPASTAAPTPDAAALSDVERGYATLVLLQGSAVMLEESAAKIQSGEAQGLAGFGQLIAIGAVLRAVDEALAEEPPVPALAASWSAARAAAPRLRDVLSRWVDKQITSADIPQELAPIKLEIDDILLGAERDLAGAYAVDRADLAKTREEALDKVKGIFEPTPTPAS
ncbi:MAG: hypothetical protein HGA45_44275 [Chloroflexales bacterium]|nr:hypothetical protein [Chloroflexales bacterium]